MTSSVTSSIRAHRVENGRTYHSYKDGRYVFPNDDIENDRLEFQHALFLRSLHGKLCLAPVPEDVQDVLDIGTGTGIWAVDFADEHPSGRVIGIGLSPIQPSFIPSNLQIYIEDTESSWNYDRKFDLIHGRMMAGSFQDWPGYFKRCYDNVKPGGYLEMQDLRIPSGGDDGTAGAETSLRWCDLMVKALNNMGRPATIVRSYKKLMEEARFVDVVEVVHKWPQNTWPRDPEYKEIGAWNLTNCLQGVQGFSMGPFTRGLGWEPAEVEVFVAGVRNDMKNRDIHYSYWPIHFVYGRKPGN